MKTLLNFATLAILALTAVGYAQESKKEPAKAPTTKALYMISGLHCEPCAGTVEESLKKAKGIGSIKVDFKGNYGTVVFDENMISAQEVARALSDTPHMMGPGMRYDGILVLSVPGVKDKAIGAKAAAALSQVAGVAKVTLFPQQESVGIQFTNKGKATSGQLLAALAKAGLKAAQYVSQN